MFSKHLEEPDLLFIIRVYAHSLMAKFKSVSLNGRKCILRKFTLLRVCFGAMYFSICSSRIGFKPGWSLG